MRKLAVILPVSLMCIFLAVGANSLAAEDSEGWASLRGDVYINMKSVAYTCGSTVSLWVKLVPDEDSDVLMQAREQLMNRGREDKALAYFYSGVLTEIDCSKNSHRELITILYDTNKNILHSTDHLHASWVTISPESSFDLVQRVVCEKSQPLASRQYEDMRSGEVAAGLP